MVIESITANLATESQQTIAVSVNIPAGAVVVGIGTAGNLGTTETMTGSTLGAFNLRARSQNDGQATVFTKVNSGGSLSNETVTFSWVDASHLPAICVWVLSSAKTTALTNTGTNIGSTAGFSATVNAVGSASYVFLGAQYYFANSTATPFDGNSTEDADKNDAVGGNGNWFGHNTSAGGPGNITVAGTWAAGAGTWSAVAIEIQDAGATAPADDDTFTLQLTYANGFSTV